jgi:hypothetical protein
MIEYQNVSTKIKLRKSNQLKMNYPTNQTDLLWLRVVLTKTARTKNSVFDPHNAPPAKEKL